MKILFLNYEYPPLGGGAGNATEYILKEYVHIPNFEVHLVTSSVDGVYHNTVVGEKIFVHSVPIGKKDRELHHQSIINVLTYAWRGYRYANKLLKKEEFDAIHAFFGVPCGLMALCLSKSYGVPYIVSLRGADVPGFSERFSLLYIFLRPLIRLVWRRAKFVISNSRKLKELAFPTAPKQKIGIIYNGVDVDHFKPDSNLRKQSPRFILTTGASRVTHRKGLRYLIEAVAQLATEYPNICAKIMGDGNARQELEILVKKLGIEKNVEFLGRIPREQTVPYYQEASIFVLPSLNEGMSNAMLEALACGLPLLATMTGGTEELLTDGENGFSVIQKSARDLAEKLKRLMNDEELCAHFGQASRRRAETMSWKNVALEYYNLYQETIKTYNN